MHYVSFARISELRLVFFLNCSIPNLGEKPNYVYDRWEINKIYYENELLTPNHSALFKVSWSSLHARFRRLPINNDVLKHKDC